MAFVRECVAGDRVTNAFGHVTGILEPRFRQDDSKFLSAVASEDDFLAQRSFHQAGDLAQYLIARKMAEFIIDSLEVINVEEDQAQRPAITYRPLQFTIQGLQKAAFVVNLR